MTTVNGLELPQLVLDLMKGGRWQMPRGANLPGAPLEQSEIPGFGGAKLYSIQEMQSETSWWINLSKPGSCLRGTPDPENPPGDIDPGRTVLIGDMGMGLDSPIALDYRGGLRELRVLRFTWSSNCRQTRWIQIAGTIESFVQCLEL